MAAQAFEGWERAGNAVDRWPTERAGRRLASAQNSRCLVSYLLSDGSFAAPLEAKAGLLAPRDVASTSRARPNSVDAPACLITEGFFAHN